MQNKLKPNNNQLQQNKAEAIMDSIINGQTKQTKQMIKKLSLAHREDLADYLTFYDMEVYGGKLESLVWIKMMIGRRF